MVEMTSLQRVATALGHREPDRVPFFLPAGLWCAGSLGLTIKEYFSRSEYMVEGQLRLLEKLGHDFVTPFSYAAVEVEAAGAEVLFFDDGPPNAGAPLLRSRDDIDAYTPPAVAESPPLVRVLDTARELKKRVGETVPVAGVVISPFSVPVMQLGFDRYIELIYEHRDLFWCLMTKNTVFCADWANRQLEAGAMAIIYFDPVSSPTIIPPEVYRETGFLVARETLARINGATVTYFASGLCGPIVADIIATGTAGVGVSFMDDLPAVKAACAGKLAVVGNLNGIEMRRWTARDADQAVKKAIAAGAAGGGFILSDNHGEIPWQVSGDTLTAIADAVRRWGRYPLTWIGQNGA